MLVKYLLAPVDNIASGGPTETLDKEDTIKFFGEDDEKPEVIELDKPVKEGDKKLREKNVEPREDEDEEIEEKPDTEDEDEEEDEDDELKELEDELKEYSDEELELITPVRRKEILAKYPKLFKDFPYIEKAYFREQQFTELFPTIEDAKIASKKAQALEGFEQELVSGNIENILKVVGEHNPKAFNKIVDDYIPTLLKVNEKAGYAVIGNIIKDTIISMVRAGKSSKSQELLDAAKELNKFIFATEDFEPPTKLSEEDKENPEEDRVKQRERALVRRQFESTRDNLNTRIDGILKKTIDGNIDPRGSMTEYVKRNASREALETVVDMIDKDPRFKSLLDKLWDRVIRNDFKQADIDRVKDAYTSKAKTLLPTVIKKARQEALKGMGKKVREEKEEVNDEPEETNPRQKKVRETTPSSNRGQKSDKDKAREIPANMSSRDFLLQD